MPLFNHSTIVGLFTKHTNAYLVVTKITFLMNENSNYFYSCFMTFTCIINNFYHTFNITCRVNYLE